MLGCCSMLSSMDMKGWKKWVMSNFLLKYCYWTLLKYFQFSLVERYFGTGFKKFGTLFCLWVKCMLFCYEVMVGVDSIQNCFLPPTNNISYPFKSTYNIHNMWFYSFKILYSQIIIIIVTISLFLDSILSLIIKICDQDS